MERDHRSAVATFFADASLVADGVTALDEQAAHHARVKRLDVGDAVRLTNGSGTIARGLIAAIRRASLEIAVHSVAVVPRQRLIHLRVPIADRERMLWLAEKATEFGVASWQGVRFRRSMSVSPRGEGSAFAEKLRARMVNALEQSGGAWLPDVVSDTTVERLEFSNSQLPMVLDVRGASLASAMSDGGRHGQPVIVLGPEGGMEDEELSMLVDAGWKRVRLTENTLRFETAGIAAIAAIRAAQLDAEG